MITEIEDYFSKGCGRCERFDTSDCSALIWIAGIEELRRICLDVGLHETVKWGHPCYMFGGRNLTIIGAFRRDFRLSFFDAALMTDPEAVLEKQGPNTPHPDMLRFTSKEQVSEMEHTIRSYLREAMRYVEAGIRPPKVAFDIEIPAELIDALDCDPELSEAFHKLTPGRQKSYVLNLNLAKATATRTARILKFRNKILAGKGAAEW
jgi:uncharacterized protein YdeI (YjbR/CyaY-like superfamily)